MQLSSSIRFLDIILSFIGLLLTLPIIIVLFCILLFDSGSPFFFQQRVGRKQKMFTLIKFRTMNKNVKDVPSHLSDPAMVSKTGLTLRKYKLDELPQLFNVLFGHMSIVGPRPCLPSQHDVIIERQTLGVFNFRPGITGLSQISGIDMSMPVELALKDAEMMNNFSIKKYIDIIILTFSVSSFSDAIKYKK